MDQCAYGDACKFSHSDEGREVMRRELGLKEFE
jgi:hypothetical protein